MNMKPKRKTNAHNTRAERGRFGAAAALVEEDRSLDDVLRRLVRPQKKNGDQRGADRRSGNTTRT